MADKRSGQGRLITKDGKVLEGNWRDDRQEGRHHVVETVSKQDYKALIDKFNGGPKSKTKPQVTIHDNSGLTVPRRT